MYVCVVFIVLQGSETLSFTSREEYLSVLNNRVLKEIFGSKTEDIRRCRRKLYNSIIRGHVARMRAKRNAYSSVGQPEGKRQFGRRSCVNRKIIMNWYLNKQGGRVWIGLI
jgi:hypothetical protein